MSPLTRPPSLLVQFLTLLYSQETEKHFHGPPSAQIPVKGSLHPVPAHPLPSVVLNHKDCLRSFCKEPSRAPSKAKPLMGALLTTKRVQWASRPTGRLPSRGAGPGAPAPLPRTAALVRSLPPAEDKPGPPRTRRGLARSRSPQSSSSPRCYPKPEQKNRIHRDCTEPETRQPHAEVKVPVLTAGVTKEERIR